MSDTRAVLLVGASGLIGTLAMEEARRARDIRLCALARRSIPVPDGVALRVSESGHWPDAVAEVAPRAVVCALGTTWRQAGKDRAAFRAVDHDLVVAVARAARGAGCDQFVLVSSAGADPRGATFYLKVKGETEADVAALGFRRLDILRPGLLRGDRQEPRLRERLAMIASPLTDRMLSGPLRRYRSIDARQVAAAALQFTREPAAGRFVHEFDGIAEAADRFFAA